jgi:hypothetical protein
MSYYGHKSFKNLFGVGKTLLNAGHHRFGGSQGQFAYKLSDTSPVDVTLHHSGVNIVNAEEDTVSVILLGNPTPAVFTDLELVIVSGSYTVPAGKYAVLLEGTVALGDVALNSNEDLHKLDPESVVSGNGKLLVFTYSQT